MNITTLSPDQFITEVKQWGAMEGSMARVRAMEKGEMYYFKFHIPNSNEILQTQMLKSEYLKFNFLELGALLTPAIWDNELKTISNKLEELNANTKQSANIGRESLRPVLEST